MKVIKVIRCDTPGHCQTVLLPNPNPSSNCVTGREGRETTLSHLVLDFSVVNTLDRGYQKQQCLNCTDMNSSYLVMAACLCTFMKLHSFGIDTKVWFKFSTCGDIFASIQATQFKFMSCCLIT